MSTVRAVTCDRCNPDARLDMPNGRGYALMSVAEALGHGWEREPGSDIDGADDTHYCIECLAEEMAAASPSSHPSPEEGSR